MRARQEQETVLPTLRLAFATASRLTEFRNQAGRRLPQGWSLNEIDFCDGGDGVLVMHDDDMDATSFLASERGGALELHAVIDERLVLLGRRRAGGVAMLPSTLPRARAA